MQYRPSRIIFRLSNKIILLYLREIIYFTSMGNYVSIVLKNQKYSLIEPLSHILTQLPKNQFIRCHNSYIINVDHLKEFDLKKCVILMSNSSEIPVSARRKRIVLNFLLTSQGFNKTNQTILYYNHTFEN
jgi:two-component system LytT family response regulator